MKYPLMLMLMALMIACQTTSKKEHEFHVEDGAVIKKYRTFDLFTMQGNDVCENDSCVIVTQIKDTTFVETLFPKKYMLKFIDMKDYWYSHNELNMYMPKDNICKCGRHHAGVPTICDMFIMNDTIYEYLQRLYLNGVFEYLKIVEPNSVKEIFVRADSVTTTDIQVIFSRILDVLGKNDEDIDRYNIRMYDLIRDKSTLQVISRETGIADTLTFKFPQSQMLGLTYNW